MVFFFSVMFYPDMVEYPAYIRTEREKRKERMLSAMIIQRKIYIAELAIGDRIPAEIFSII